MRLLAFSDLHRDLEGARSLAQRSVDFDCVLAAGDFASVHEGLEEAIGALSAIEVPTILIPGNNETEDALRDACEGWEAAIVLHGEATEIDGISFFGLGAGVPTTPWEWSFDLSDADAERQLVACPEGAVLVVHSPPQGHCDRSSSGEHLGSHAILDAIALKQPPLTVCGHIHEAWGERSRIGPTDIVNLGPGGTELEI